MGIGSLKELYLDELADLYDAETQGIRALSRLSDSARAPELRDVLARHSQESRLHLERLQLIFTHWGERIRPRPCAAIAGIVQEADDRVHEATTQDVRDAAIVGAAQRMEHYEIAAYGCARTYARRLNRHDEARLLQETLDDEGRADRRLTEIAEAHLNDDARSEEDMHGRRPPRLRYIPGKRLDVRRLSDSGRLQVRNGDGEDLGTFDGLIVGQGQQPRYIVVDARGVFTGRRYVLPVHHVRFDDRARELRVDLDKEVADRYPEFDADAFDSMNDIDWGRYERRIREFFPVGAAEPGRAADANGGITDVAPEWLLTGVWMTAGPDRVERLPEEARTYVNSFTPTSGSAGEDADREQMIAHGDDETETPPHGDKLRD
jgi:ferritin-like metal-binding protein YciE